MNLNLSGSTQSNIPTTQTAVSNIAGITTVTTANTASKPTEIPAGSLTTGQVFSGEVAEINGKDILLLLGNHQTMSARLEGDISLVLGQNVYFEVKSNSNNQISLRPLYTNLNSTDPSILKALDAAGLPVNEKSVAMTSSMMEEGMPINKNALQTMFRQVNQHQTIEPQTIVQMTKLGLPITELNVTQFENYKNLEHQIVKDINVLTDGMPELAGKLIGEGNIEEAISFSKELVSMLKDGLPPISDLPQDKEAVVNPESQINFSQKNNTVLQSLTLEQRQNLVATFEQLGITPEEREQLLSGKLPDGQLLDLLKNTFSNPQIHQNEHFSKLLKGNEYQLVLKNLLSEQLLLKPDEVAKEGKIEELYQRLNEQSQKINQILQNLSKSTPELAKSAANMQDNMNFMNQMNQMLTYIQLPLKMAQENANGDLYVYTNKKNLANKDGNVSALLHLEMEHLGTMDIHVTMQQSNVSTHFYLQKEEMLDFIEENIHILNDRLTKKGYHMSTAVTTKEQEDAPGDIVDEFLKKHGEAPMRTGSPMKFSFDVRA